jgi:hypothetical protein
VVLFIKHSAFGRDFAQERVSFRQPPFHVVWGAHDDVQRKRWIAGKLDLDGLIELVPGRHDNQDVHVAVAMRLPVGAGAEQNDLVWLEALGYLAGEPANHNQGNIHAAIPAGWRGIQLDVCFVGHKVILQENFFKKGVLFPNYLPESSGSTSLIIDGENAGSYNRKMTSAPHSLFQAGEGRGLGGG